MNMLPPHRHRCSLEEPLRLPNLPGITNWSGKIAYLDRDGVLNRWREGYVNSVNELKLLDGAGKAVGLLRRNGFRICIVTNQSPVGRGIWGHEALSLIHDSLKNNYSVRTKMHRLTSYCTAHTIPIKAHGQENQAQGCWRPGDN